MRDYKQMQEIQKLKSQAEQDTDGGKEDIGESEKYSHRSPGMRGWLAYLSEYYKWPLLIGAIALIGVVLGVMQIRKTAGPDYAMMYVGPYYLNTVERDKLKNSFAMLSGESLGDVNGDGEFRLNFLDLTVYLPQDASGNKYVYDDQNSAYTRFQTELRAGDALIYFLQPAYFKQAKADGILQPLSELGIELPEGCDEYGVYLGDLDCCTLPGFRMPSDTVLCLRRDPGKDDIRYGRTMEGWEQHRDLFISLLQYRDPERKPEQAGDADLSVLLVSSDPLVRSVREPVQTLIGSLCADTNGDGIGLAPLHSIRRQGSTAQQAVIAKQVRTALVTGEECLWILDAQAFRYAADKGLIAELPVELRDRQDAIEGLGLPLSGLRVAGKEGFAELRGDLILCARRTPEEGEETYGRTALACETAQKTLLLLAKYGK